MSAFTFRNQVHNNTIWTGAETGNKLSIILKPITSKSGFIMGLYHTIGLLYSMTADGFREALKLSSIVRKLFFHGIKIIKSLFH